MIAKRTELHTLVWGTQIRYRRGRRRTWLTHRCRRPSHFCGDVNAIPRPWWLGLFTFGRQLTKSQPFTSLYLWVPAQPFHDKRSHSFHRRVNRVPCATAFFLRRRKRWRKKNRNTRRGEKVKIRKMRRLHQQKDVDRRNGLRQLFWFFSHPAPRTCYVYTREVLCVLIGGCTIAATVGGRQDWGRGRGRAGEAWGRSTAGGEDGKGRLNKTDSSITQVYS